MRVEDVGFAEETDGREDLRNGLDRRQRAGPEIPHNAYGDGPG